VVGKFAWHLPLNRQTDMMRGQGIALDRSTLVHWGSACCWAELLRAYGDGDGCHGNSSLIRLIG